jgi:hypothetical protein
MGQQIRRRCFGFFNSSAARVVPITQHYTTARKEGNDDEEVAETPEVKGINAARWACYDSAVRSNARKPASMSGYVSVEARVPEDRPRGQAWVGAHGGGSARHIAGARRPSGTPSIPPECLLPTLLLRAFRSIRGERPLMEEFDYNLRSRRFVGPDMGEPIWVPALFTKGRDQLLNQGAARRFTFAAYSR